MTASFTAVTLAPDMAILQAPTPERVQSEQPSVTVTIIRLATEADKPLLMLFMKAMLRELYELGYGIAPTELNLAIYWTQVLLPALRSDAHGIALAWLDEKPVGIILCVPNPSLFEDATRNAFNHGVWVHPMNRRKGVGAALQRFAQAHLAKLGFTELVSHVAVANEPAIALANSTDAQAAFHIINTNLMKGAA